MGCANAAALGCAGTPPPGLLIMPPQLPAAPAPAAPAPAAWASSSSQRSCHFADPKEMSMSDGAGPVSDAVGGAVMHALPGPAPGSGTAKRRALRAKLMPYVVTEVVSTIGRWCGGAAGVGGGGLVFGRGASRVLIGGNPKERW